MYVETLKKLKGNGCKVYIALNSGRYFTAEISSINGNDIVFKDVSSLDGVSLVSLAVSVSNIEAVGEVQTSGDDESVYASNGFAEVPLTNLLCGD